MYEIIEIVKIILSICVRGYSSLKSPQHQKKELKFEFKCSYYSKKEG